MSETDEERQHLFNDVEVSVRGGCEDEASILAGLDDRVEMMLGTTHAALAEELGAYARQLFREQQGIEAAWTEPSLNDFIDRAFEELDAKGIVTSQGVGHTMSDGWSDVNGLASRRRPVPRGAVFFHGQDLESGVRGEGLLLAFGAYENDEAKQEAASLAIAREVRETLARHGVRTEWNGDVNERLLIPPFEWRKRRYTQMDWE
ncbi:hypothetical protein D7Y21_07935 [Corallococcus sp. AB045]|uniref:DUF6891 domain-containing protein n=1 Tax=Corallococcus sp. AB045 TaxID=2316719 RepID=UPI000EE5A001|nr:hypothetical protein [Corallococcus sp. AB045]RKH90114.1 hypothetical protein D7Y21_07935 [Corallococcus sp. AB045]